MKVDKPTPHSFRRTFVSNSINAGVAANIVAKTSQHKDIRMLNQYADVNTSVKVAPGLAMGRSMNKFEAQQGIFLRKKVRIDYNEECSCEEGKLFLVLQYNSIIIFLSHLFLLHYFRSIR